MEGFSRFNVLDKKFVNFGIEDGLAESHHFQLHSNDEMGHYIFGWSGGFIISVSHKNYQKSNLFANTIITKFSILANETEAF